MITSRAHCSGGQWVALVPRSRRPPRTASRMPEDVGRQVMKPRRAHGAITTTPRLNVTMKTSTHHKRLISQWEADPKGRIEMLLVVISVNERCMLQHMLVTESQSISINRSINGISFIYFPSSSASPQLFYGNRLSTITNVNGFM